MCYFLPIKCFSVCRTPSNETSSFDVDGVPFAFASVELIVVGEFVCQEYPRPMRSSCWYLYFEAPVPDDDV